MKRQYKRKVCRGRDELKFWVAGHKDKRSCSDMEDSARQGEDLDKEEKWKKCERGR